MRPRKNSAFFSCRVWEFAEISLVIGQFVDSGTYWALLVIVLTADAVEVNQFAEMNVIERIRTYFNYPALCVIHFLIQYLLCSINQALYIVRKLYFLFNSLHVCKVLRAGR